jgi:3',5'-cyclic AMP phosphodiesterase CpdA
MQAIDRRQFMSLAAYGGAVFISGLPGAARAQRSEDFYFVQLSDSHWGFEGPENPDARGSLPKAIAAVNALSPKPDFVIFTGDLTHTTEDAAQRRQRMAEFQKIASGLDIATVRYIPGEHDAALDAGKAFSEFFGPTRYAFQHKAVHFIVLDNVSDPAAKLGDRQLDWLASQLRAVPPDARLIVFAHRPLFDLYPQWDWATRDGDKAIELLQQRPGTTVFYGHIHQENHRTTGTVVHHAARSLMFPLPAPGSQPRRTPVPWDPAQPYRNLGFREIEARKSGLDIREQPLARA